MAKRTIGPIDPKKVADTLELAGSGSGLSNCKLIRTMADDSTTVDAATQAVNVQHGQQIADADAVRDQLAQLADDLESSDSVDSESL